MHVNTDQLVDIAEGTRPESSAPHLAGCEPCRAQLHDLRAMMSAASEVEAPEPSPLFWDHLSARVSGAVALEAAPRRSWLNISAWIRIAMPLAVAAALLLAVTVNVRAPRSDASPSAIEWVPQAAVSAELLSDAAMEDDASLAMVAGLAAGLDADAAKEAGLSSVGSADHAVAHMSAGELRELRRLLKDELTPSGN